MIRGVGLRGAIAVNIITMIGIGPLITIPLVVAALPGGLAIVGWVVGAVVALCDGLVWAELSSRYPASGGTYVYLREAFGRQDWGRLFAFLFNWQFFFSAPLLIASGYIGFAQYGGYLYPKLGASPNLQHLVAAALGIVVLILLYRRVTTVAHIAIALAVAATLTLVAVIFAGVPHVHAAALSAPKHGPAGLGFVLALGTALVITLYDYSGYNAAALVGDEVIAPARTIPRAVVTSIAVIAVLYILLQVSVLSVVPWQQIVASKSQFVAATAVENVWGAPAARGVTVLILLTAFASTYGLLFGFSRIPYAAALDDEFFPIFARLHPRGRFPYVSLLVVGLLAIPACFFTLDAVISFLTAGIVLIQAIAQIVALAILRAREGGAPFRMWFYPLPALVALVAWLFIFYSSGNGAMLYGVLTLIAGVIAYLITARAQRRWPFVAAALVILSFLIRPNTVLAAGFDQSAIVQRHGYPVFEVQGKPFFVYGAAFFYERIPKHLWRPSLEAYKALGINTIDLYLIWNWHELSDGDFDFTGRTNGRRDLHAVLRLLHRLGFRTILRPGPVIRNEWRNGGYPAWLLQRPEYNMPLHDILEGRYPATATLQNAHSDDAAAEWIHNPTHMRYAARWLRRVLTEVRPWAGDAIAIALDDDQGAYLDNQTWPAPHFANYINDLASVVRGVAGTKIPLFINTYQMKVTASAPVWAWGNWYQSDAYRLGEHDRQELEFSTELLATQPGLPVMSSEFQAGWLQGPDEVHPRRVAAENTTLALHTLLQSGARGIVNFPVQDTIYPGGWEVPFANASYAWDAALTLRGGANPRYGPTQDFGRLVAQYGPLLAQTHRVADAAIAYTVSAYDPRSVDNPFVAAVAAATMAAQKQCRAVALTCDLVDLRYASQPQLARYRYLVVLRPIGPPDAFVYEVAQRIRRFAHRGQVVASPLDVHPRTRTVNVANAVLGVSVGREPFGFLDIVNYDSNLHTTGPIRLYARGLVTRALPAVKIEAGAGVLIPIDLPLQRYAARFSERDRLRYATCSARILPLSPSTIEFGSRTACQLSLTVHGKSIATGIERAQSIVVRSNGQVTARRYARPSSGAAIAYCDTKHSLQFAGVCWPLPDDRNPAPGTASAYSYDVLEDGEPWLIMANRFVQLALSPSAGARAFGFQEPQGQNAFTSIGALRDDVSPEPPASSRDYISAYTHQFPAGTFNRPYDCRILKSGPQAEASCQYSAPDLGVSFERTLTLNPDQRSFSLRLRMMRPEGATTQGVLVNSLTATPQRKYAQENSALISIGMALDVTKTSQRIQGNAFGFFDAGAHRLYTLNWNSSDSLRVVVDGSEGTQVVRIMYPANIWHEIVFGYYDVSDRAAAQGIVASLKGREPGGANRR